MFKQIEMWLSLSQRWTHIVLVNKLDWVYNHGKMRHKQILTFGILLPNSLMYCSFKNPLLMLIICRYQLFIETAVAWLAFGYFVLGRPEGVHSFALVQPWKLSCSWLYCESVRICGAWKVGPRCSSSRNQKGLFQPKGQGARTKGAAECFNYEKQ